MAEPVQQTVLPGSIAAGQSLSAGINVIGTITAIVMPVAWTPALLTFQISPDNGTTWFDLVDSTQSEVSFNVTPGTCMTVPPSTALDNKTWIRLRSGSRSYPITQTAQRDFQIIGV